MSFSLVVDENGYIGEKKPAAGNTYYAMLMKGKDYSTLGIGQITLIIPELGKVVIGGKEYGTTKIGNLLWITEHLDYRIPGIDFNGSDQSIPACWYYNNESTEYAPGYGLLYNWYAVEYLESNKGTLLPDGWRVPTHNDAQSLLTTLGVSDALKMKSETGWGSSYNGLSFYGFNFLPSGYLDNTFAGRGSYAGIDLIEQSSSNNDNMYCYNNYSQCRIEYYKKTSARSIRLVKDIS